MNAAILVGSLGLLLGVWAGWRGWRAWCRVRPHLLEDLLKHILELRLMGQEATETALAERLDIPLAVVRRHLNALAAKGLVRHNGDWVTLTDAGMTVAVRILRAHRLLERYFADYTDLPATQLHRWADRLEHHLSEAEARHLAATLGHPAHDPHGDPIPQDHAVGLPAAALPLPRFPVHTLAEVVHVEDEPESLFAEAVRAGLWPGVHVQVEGVSNGAVQVRVLEQGKVVALSHDAAQQVHVVPCTAAPSAMPRLTLADVPLRHKVRVVGLSPRLRGLLRRRLLDLGFTPGAVVEPVMESAFGRSDPRAYRVRGTLIALRREQAEHIFVEPFTESPSPTPTEAEP